MQELILFCLTYVFVFIIYQLLIVRRAKKMRKNGNDYYAPMEVSYLVSAYKLDLDKVNYNQLLQIVAITSSFDIAIIVSVVLFLKNFILRVLLGFSFMLFIIFISYYLVYLFYKKKGMIKHE